MYERLKAARLLRRREIRGQELRHFMNTKPKTAVCNSSSGFDRRLNYGF